MRYQNNQNTHKGPEPKASDKKLKDKIKGTKLPLQQTLINKPTVYNRKKVK